MSGKRIHSFPSFCCCCIYTLMCCVSSEATGRGGRERERNCLRMALRASSFPFFAVVAFLLVSASSYALFFFFLLFSWLFVGLHVCLNASAHLCKTQETRTRCGT
jgi:hypothetical protein